MDGNRDGGTPGDPSTGAPRGGAGGLRAAGGFRVRGMPGTGAGGDPGAGVLEASSGKWGFWGGQSQNRGRPSTTRVCVCVGVCAGVCARAKAP